MTYLSPAGRDNFIADAYASLETLKSDGAAVSGLVVSGVANATGASGRHEGDGPALSFRKPASSRWTFQRRIPHADIRQRLAGRLVTALDSRCPSAGIQLIASSGGRDGLSAWKASILQQLGSVYRADSPSGNQLPLMVEDVEPIIRDGLSFIASYDAALNRRMHKFGDKLESLKGELALEKSLCGARVTAQRPSDEKRANFAPIRKMTAEATLERQIQRAMNADQSANADELRVAGLLQKIYYAAKRGGAVTSEHFTDPTGPNPACHDPIGYYVDSQIAAQERQETADIEEARQDIAHLEQKIRRVAARIEQFADLGGSCPPPPAVVEAQTDAGREPLDGTVRHDPKSILARTRVDEGGEASRKQVRFDEQVTHVRRFELDTEWIAPGAPDPNSKYGFLTDTASIYVDDLRSDLEADPDMILAMPPRDTFQALRADGAQIVETTVPLNDDGDIDSQRLSRWTPRLDD